MNLFQNILNKAKSSVNYLATGQLGSDIYDAQQNVQLKQQGNIIQSFLNESRDKPDMQSKRNAVVQMLQNGEDDTFIQDTITKKMGYDPSVGVGGRIVSALGTRLATAGESYMQDKSVVEKGLSAVKDIIATPFDIAGAVAQPVIEPIVKPIIESAPVKYGMEKYGQFRESNPRLAQNIEAVGGIASSFAPFTKTGQTVIKAPGKAIVSTAKNVTPKVVQGLNKAGSIIKKAPSFIDEGIETGVEKLASKALGSSDGTAELFKATSPSYNVLAKRKDIAKIKDKAKLADKAVIDAGYVPKTTTERVSAYSDSMKKYWKEVEDARGASKTEFDAGDIADVIDDEIKRLSVKGTVNPAIQGDINALMKQSEYFRGLGKVDMPTLGNQRTLINTITDWGAKTEYGDTFSAVMKKAVGKIREVEDGILGKVGNGKASDALRKYGALRSMYDDIVKQDIKLLRAKGLPIEESFGRISGLAEMAGGVGQLIANPKQALPTIISGGSKVLLGKVAGKMKDADYLIQTGYEKLLKSKNTPNGTPKGNPTVVRPNSNNTKSVKKTIVKPNTIKNESVVPKKTVNNPIVKKTMDNDEYFYHGTDPYGFSKIKEEGIIPQRRGVSSLSKTEEYSRNFAFPEATGTKGEMLRVKKDFMKGKLFNTRKQRPKSDEMYEVLTKQTIPPEAIEVLKDGKWQPLITPKSNAKSKKLNTNASDTIPEGYFKNAFGEIQKNPSNKKGGFIKLPTKPSIKRSPDIEGVPNGLIEEARKYKSAEEFVMAQGEPVYHGSKGKYTDFTTFDKSKIGSSVGSDKEGIFFTNSKILADRYTFNPMTGEKGNILESYVTFKNPLKIDVEQVPLSYFTKNKEKIFKDVKKGKYDGVIIKSNRFNEDIVIALEPSQIKTDSQLKQIYEQAKKPKSIIKK